MFREYKKINKNKFKPEKSNFVLKRGDKIKLPELNFNILEKINTYFDFVITNDFENIEFPNENKAVFIITSTNKNPNLFIKNIEKKEGIKELIIFASRNNGFTYQTKCSYFICSQENFTNKRYRVHAKIIIINEYIIIGSGNLSKTNTSIENYIILNNKCLKQAIKQQLKQTLKG